METTVADHESRIRDLERKSTEAAARASKEDSPAEKWEKKMRSKIYQASKSSTPVYYMTSKGNLIDLRAAIHASYMHGLTVSQDFADVAGFNTVWVGH